jgi:hypothetical protein
VYSRVKIILQYTVHNSAVCWHAVLHTFTGSLLLFPHCDVEPCVQPDIDLQWRDMTEVIFSLLGLTRLMAWLRGKTRFCLGI